VRGYPQELGHFIDAILSRREPIFGIDLVRDVVEAIYDAYASAEKGIRIELKRQST
jgi:hypothetical protein